MNRGKILLTALVGAAPLTCGLLASVCTFTTAFQIGFSLIPLIVFCIVASLLLSFWMTVPKYGFGFGALYLAGVILLAVYRSPSIKAGGIVYFRGVLKMLPEGLTGSFDVPWWEEQAAAVSDPELCVAYLMMVVAAGAGILLAYALLRSRVAALPLMILLPPVLVSFIYTNQQPALWTVILLTIYCGYTLLGNGFKKGESPQRGLFLAAVAPAMLLFIALITTVFPRETYRPIPEETRQKVFSDLFGDIGDRIMKRLGNGSPDEIELDAVRARENDLTVMFSVRASKDGGYHLRVHSYGAYSGNRWREAKPYNGAWRSMEALGNRQSGADDTLEIRDAFSDERIVPYAFRAGSVATSESYVKAKAMRDYTWHFTKAFGIEPHAVTEEEREYYAFAAEQYTMQNERLLAIAQEAGITPPQSTDAYTVYQTAWDVAAFVRNSAAYTQSPASVPAGKDFVLYFLTESKEGYCVHFASATTAILQSLGIPARYTSGYYVSGVSGTWLNVDGSAKHAWTEIYLCGVGWIPIESTPPFPENPTVGDLLSQVGKPNIPSSEPTVGTVTAPPIVPQPTPNTPIEPEPSVPAPQTPDPSAENNGKEPIAPQTPQKETGSARKGAWWLLLLIPILPALWAGTGILIRKRRNAIFRDSNVRRAIPEMAHYLKRLERCGLPADPDAERWAVEAAFSDHPMKEEQKELRKRVRAAQKEITKNRPLRRFLFRWILFRI